MSLANVLSGILHGKENFCYLCYGIIGEDAVHLDDEIFLDTDRTETMGQILFTVLGEEISCIPSILYSLCVQCKISAVENFKFLEMCKQNSENLYWAIESLQESVENTIQDMDIYNSLYIKLDVNMYSSQQFYDGKKISNPLHASKQFCSINNRKGKTNVQNLELTLVNNSLREYDNKRKMIKNKHEDRETKPRLTYELYNIPSVHTLDMIYDVNNPTEYKCKVCLRKYPEQDKLRLHYFKKHYPKCIKCSKCTQMFISEKILKYHQDIFHDVGVCSECGKHFATTLKLEKHEMGHKIKITCQECGRTYRSKEAFKKHVTDQICQQKTTKKNSEQGIYQCDFCKKRYWHKPYLAKHIQHEHGNVVGYRCEYCSKQFYTPSRLQTHLVKHTREKNFVCMFCNGKFVTKSSLVYHTRLHTGEKPYKCEFCSSAFLSASRRLDHTRRQHLPPSLECDMCKVKFKSTGSLLKHRKRHYNPNSRLNTSNRLHPPTIRSTEVETAVFMKEEGTETIYKVDDD